MDSIQKLIIQNREWTTEKLRDNPRYFNNQPAAQRSKCLWIGCSDGQRNSNEIDYFRGSDVFVHRTIASLVDESDLDLMSVVNYAIEALRVSQIVVCGHYGCSCIRASINSNEKGFSEPSLEPVREVEHQNEKWVRQLKDPKDRLNKLVEFVIREQARKLGRLAAVRNSWKTRQCPSVHGLIFNAEDGQLSELITLIPDPPLAKAAA